MSAGPFTTGVYQGDTGILFPVRVQPETKALTINAETNDEPTGTPQVGQPSALISGTRRQNGVIARKINIVLTADGIGTTAEYKAGTTHSVVVLSSARFASWGKGMIGTYLGIPCRVVSKTPERVN
jgi:hypothetical protein